MSNRSIVILLVCALIFMVAVLVGVGAGYLARRDNASYPAALARAVAAFAGTLALAAAVVAALTGVIG